MKSIQPKAVASSVSVSTSTESAVAASAIRVLKIASCPSLSGRSSLTYHLGLSADSDIRLRVFANSGGGYFSQEWLSLKVIRQILEKRTAANPVASSAFGGLFAGKSVNSTGFTLAILKHLGLVKPLIGKPRCYEAIDPSSFMAELKTLIESSIDVRADQPRKLSVPDKTPVSKAKQRAA